MVNERIRLDLRQSTRPEAPYALVVEWTSRPDLSPVRELATKRERLDQVQKIFASLKAPVLSRLSRFEDVNVEDLPGTPQAIVHAPIGRWRKLTEEGSLFDTEDTIRLLPNESFYTQGP